MSGYGYAATSKQNRKKWLNLNNLYLLKRKELKFTSILIDSRHDPMDIDLELIERLENFQKKYLIILTKCDKISNKEIIERKEQLKHITSNCKYCISIITYSSVTNLGRKELLKLIKNNIA